MANKQPNPYQAPGSTGEVGFRFNARWNRWGLRVLAGLSLLYFGIECLLLSSSEWGDVLAAEVFLLNLAILLIWNVLAFAMLPGRVALGVVATVVQVGIGITIWWRIPTFETGAVLAINGTFIVGFVCSTTLLWLARRPDVQH